MKASGRYYLLLEFLSEGVILGICGRNIYGGHLVRKIKGDMTPCDFSKTLLHLAINLITLDWGLIGPYV
jgi:hypothetical protein